MLGSRSAMPIPVLSPVRDAIRDRYADLDRFVRLMAYRAGVLPPQLDELAAEVLSDLARRAIETEDRFDSGREVLPWLRSIAIHALQDRLRADGRRVRRHQARQSNFWDGLAASATAATVEIQEMLERIDVEHRRVLELHYFEGHDCTEIARIMNLPSAEAARMRLHRARQACKLVLQPEEIHE